MKRLLLFIVLCLTIIGTQAQIKKGGPAKIDRGPVKIDSVIFYRSFVRGGTTIGIKSYLQSPGTAGDLIDSTHQKINIDINRLAEVMNNAPRRRHLQQKIPGIDLAGKFYTPTGLHYFIICGNGWIADMTGWREFIIKNPEDKAFLDVLIAKK